MGPRLFIRCLGEPVLLNARGEEIRLRVRKHLALVLFLALEPRRRATRERLRRFLWPEGNSAQSLSQAIVEVRRGLGDDVFEAGDHYLALKRTADICTDLDVLRTGDADLMLRELSQSFWSHVLFDGMEIEEAEEWNSWLWLERSRWREKLGRMGEEAAAGLGPEISVSERARLKEWSAHLLGRTPGPLRPMKRLLHWDEADPRVSSVREELDGEMPHVILLRCVDVDDALSVVLAATRKPAGHPNVLDATTLDIAHFGAEFAAALLQLPGYVGASPESISSLREFVGSLSAKLPAHELLADVLAASAESTGLLLLLSKDQTDYAASLAGLACSTANLTLIVIGADADAESLTQCYQRALSLDIGPLTDDQFLDGSALLHGGRSLDGESFQQALKSCGGSLMLLEMLLDGSTKRLLPNVSASHPLAGEDECVDALSRASGLTASRALRLLQRACTSEPPRIPAASIHVPTRQLHKEWPRSDQRLGLSLVTSDPEKLLDEVETAVLRGDASGHSINAILLSCRTRLGLANNDVVAHEIEQRLRDVERGGATLEPAEAIAFAQLLTFPSVSDRVPHERVRTLEDYSTKTQGRNNVLLLSSLMLSQRSRDVSGEGLAIELLRNLQHEDEMVAQQFKLVALRAATLRALRTAAFAQGHALTAKQFALAGQLAWTGAAENALANRIKFAFRLGNYSEVRAIGSRLGHKFMRAVAKFHDPKPLMLLHALRVVGEQKQVSVLRDQLEDVYSANDTPRGLLMQAEYLQVVGATRRARQAAAKAYDLGCDRPVAEQEGVWARWAMRLLPTTQCHEVIAALEMNAPTVDARDRLVALTEARARGLNVRGLEQLGFGNYRLGRAALI